MRTSDSPYAQCCECHLYLTHFRNNWATEAIAKQFLGNKCQCAYDMGWIDAPEKYTHLKENASKRSLTGSQKKRALLHVGSTLRKKNRGVLEEMLEFKLSSDKSSGSEEEGVSSG